MDGWMDKWTEDWIHALKEEWMQGRKDGWIKSSTLMCGKMMLSLQMLECPKIQE